ncbi:hypothetical protein [Glaciibacter sp. 2TAF33]|uniref:hypothetical protein n=1 Tax=Glaciibacter sp. 2TAF33 TaxID=3233015 RepID=UPI003F908B85
MNGPDTETRGRIAEWADETLPDASDDTAEGWLDEVLGVIADAIASDEEDDDLFGGELDQDAAAGILAAAESWASVVSYAVGRVYAPTSPWPRRLAGWATKISARLNTILAALHAAMSAAVTTLSATFGITSYSIGLSFPWGVSVSLNF